MISPLSTLRRGDGRQVDKIEDTGHGLLFIVQLVDASTCKTTQRLNHERHSFGIHGHSPHGLTPSLISSAVRVDIVLDHRRQYTIFIYTHPGKSFTVNTESSASSFGK